MNISKPEFPKKLIATESTKSGSFVAEKRLVSNNSEETAFRSQHEKNRYVTITEEELSKEELKRFPIETRIQKRIPKWAYFVLVIIVALIVYFNEEIRDALRGI